MASPTAADHAAIAAKALALRDADDPDEAASLLRDALVAAGDAPLLWQTLGLVHRAREDSAAAMAALQRAAALAPDDGRIAHALARVTLEAGLPATALFDRARALAPTDGTVLIGRSAAQLAEGAGEAAITDLADACRASPFWLEGHAALADLRWLMGDTAGFIASFAEALRDNPRSLPLWLALLDAYQRVDRYDWAEQALAAATRMLGDIADLLPMRAVCASELGQTAAADALFARLPIAANQPLAVRYLRHLLRAQRPDEAARFGEPLVANPRSSGPVWPYLGIAWRIIGDSRLRWLEGDGRLVRTLRLYQPDELAPLAACLRAIHKARHAPAGQSVRVGTQTDGPLFARIEPEIRKLRDRIRLAITEHLATLGPTDPAHPTLGCRPQRVRFAGSWSVRLTSAGYHSNHIHPQGWLSSAFYVVVPGEAVAGAPPAGHLRLGMPPDELALGLAPVRTIMPEPGCLVLFPSIMWHGTAPIAGGERLTVAFDVSPPPR